MRVLMPFPRYVLDNSSQATVIEHHVGEEGAANFTNLVEEVMLDRGDNLTHYKLVESPEQDLHVASIHVEQCRDAQFTSFNICVDSLVLPLVSWRILVAFRVSPVCGPY